MHALGSIWGIAAPPRGMISPCWNAACQPASLHGWSYRRDAAALEPWPQRDGAFKQDCRAILAAETGAIAAHRGPSRCGVVCLGELGNERALRRRLIAAGRAEPNADASTLVRRLFEIYAAQHKTPEPLVEAVQSHLEGRYALIALIPLNEGPVLLGLQHGAPLWFYRHEGAAALSSHRLARAPYDMARLEPGDLVIARPDRFALVDQGGMRIEKRLGAGAMVMGQPPLMDHAQAHA